jgi:glycosyltransferase involved in cell wall biosynthesis
VVGKGSYSNKLKAHAKKLGFTPEEVIFTGFASVEDLQLLYARADLFLFPSLYDNFGLVKVEAAAFYTACVLIKDSAAGWGVTHKVNGYLSDNTVSAFAGTIEEALSDREKLKAVGQCAARDLYFNWRDCADILIKRYREIISAKNKNRENK